MRQVYVETPLKAGDLAELKGESYIHLTRSLRARVGEPIRMVDPDFAAYAGTIVAIDRHAATLRAQEMIPPAPPALPLVLGLCAPAADAFDSALEAAVQLGVSEFVPLESKHSRSPEMAKMARWERIARESCCQSLRARPPRIGPVQSLDNFLRLAHPGSKTMAWQGAPTQGVQAGKGPQVLLVGPEGGFDGAEINLAREQGWSFMSLGPHILRVPVAVAVGLGLLQASRVA